MDAFTTLEFPFPSETDFPTVDYLDPSYDEGDVMRELVDADRRLGYGGYCVVS